MENILRDRHGLDFGEENDFTVRSMAQGLDALSSITDALKFFLVAIASIALVVGGFWYYEYHAGKCTRENQ